MGCVIFFQRFCWDSFKTEAFADLRFAPFEAFLWPGFSVN